MRKLSLLHCSKLDTQDIKYSNIYSVVKKKKKKKQPLVKYGGLYDVRICGIKPKLCDYPEKENEEDTRTIEWLKT